MLIILFPYFQLTTAPSFTRKANTEREKVRPSERKRVKQESTQVHRISIQDKRKHPPPGWWIFTGERYTPPPPPSGFWYLPRESERERAKKRASGNDECEGRRKGGVLCRHPQVSPPHSKARAHVNQTETLARIAKKRKNGQSGASDSRRYSVATKRSPCFPPLPTIVLF